MNQNWSKNHLMKIDWKSLKKSIKISQKFIEYLPKIKRKTIGKIGLKININWLITDWKLLRKSVWKIGPKIA